MMNEWGPILLFDGVCNLCSSSVQFVLKHNKSGNIRFASLQSETGKQLLKEHGLSHQYIDSLVLLQNGTAHVKSDAALRVTKHLESFWRLLLILLIVPSFIRNPIYDWIARNRYKWFGKKDVCWIPQPQWKSRFLD